MTTWMITKHANGEILSLDRISPDITYIIRFDWYKSYLYVITYGRPLRNTTGHIPITC